MSLSYSELDSDALLAQVRACDLCREHLPLGPRPVLQFHEKAQILIVGQAPGSKVHRSGIPFDDPSGDRLRAWMGVARERFYDARCMAILPMGFCYPGTGSSGDLPPRPECERQWRAELLGRLPKVKLTVVLGQYAQGYHLPGKARSVTERVKAWRDHWPQMLPLPHPSPRNNRWLVRNPWFEQEVLPRLQQRVAELLPPVHTP